MAGSASANEGAPSTSWSVMVCTAVASAGMGMPGLIRKASRRVSWPRWKQTTPTSMMRSCSGLVPVVSKSMTASGISDHDVLDSHASHRPSMVWMARAMRSAMPG
jgi:hypothetical protein